MHCFSILHTTKSDKIVSSEVQAHPGQEQATLAESGIISSPSDQVSYDGKCHNYVGTRAMAPFCSKSWCSPEFRHNKSKRCNIPRGCCPTGEGGALTSEDVIFYTVERGLRNEIMVHDCRMSKGILRRVQPLQSIAPPTQGTRD